MQRALKKNSGFTTSRAKPRIKASTQNKKDYFYCLQVRGKASRDSSFLDKRQREEFIRESLYVFIQRKHFGKGTFLHTLH